MAKGAGDEEELQSVSTGEALRHMLSPQAEEAFEVVVLSVVGVLSPFWSLWSPVRTGRSQ